MDILMKIIWTFAILALLLTACADQNDEATGVDEPQVAEPEPTIETPDEPTMDTTDLAEMARSDPEGFREAMRDPERRQAAMEAMRERREMDPEQRQRRDEMRERMRQRREELMAEREGLEPGERMRDRRGARGAWWEDESISENLGLQEQQAETLGQAHNTLTETQRQSRQTLAQSQRQLHQALQTGDRERIQGLLEERHAATVALAEAERDWMNTLLEQLSDEQIRTLAEEHPRALAPRRR